MDDINPNPSDPTATATPEAPTEAPAQEPAPETPAEPTAPAPEAAAPEAPAEPVTPPQSMEEKGGSKTKTIIYLVIAVIAIVVFLMLFL